MDRCEDHRASPRLIAHRGFAAEYPENTIAAVENAASTADAIELDIRRCQSGELVVFHDETLERLTEGRGPVADTPAEVLFDLEVGASGEAIPRLGDMVDTVPESCGLVIELKEPGLAADVLDRCAQYQHEILVSSFRPHVLEEVRALDPRVPTALLFAESMPHRLLRPIAAALPEWTYRSEEVRARIERAVELGCTAVHPRRELCLQTDVVDLAHEAGLSVDAWTITTPEEYRQLSAVGVDGVIADRPVG